MKKVEGRQPKNSALKQAIDVIVYYKYCDGK